MLANDVHLDMNPSECFVRERFEAIYKHVGVSSGLLPIPVPKIGLQRVLDLYKLVAPILGLLFGAKSRHANHDNGTVGYHRTRVDFWVKKRPQLRGHF